MALIIQQSFLTGGRGIRVTMMLWHRLRHIKRLTTAHNNGGAKVPHYLSMSKNMPRKFHLFTGSLVFWRFSGINFQPPPLRFSSQLNRDGRFLCTIASTCSFISRPSPTSNLFVLLFLLGEQLKWQTGRRTRSLDNLPPCMSYAGVIKRGTVLLSYSLMPKWCSTTMHVSLVWHLERWSLVLFVGTQF